MGNNKELSVNRGCTEPDMSEGQTDLTEETQMQKHKQN